MKTILILTVGLMLAGCGSTENDVRNHGVASTSRIALPDRGNGIAVDTICVCCEDRTIRRTVDLCIRKDPMLE